MTAKPRAALCLPGRAGLSGWGLWRGKHGGREDRSTVRQGTGAGAMACPLLGRKQQLLGCTRAALPMGAVCPAPGGAARERLCIPQPRTGFIATHGHGALGSTLRAAPGTAGLWGLRREQRTRGRMEQRGAPWHTDTNARTGASGAETRTSERWGQWGRGRGTRQGGSLPRTRLYTRSAERGACSSRC